MSGHVSGVGGVGGVGGVDGVDGVGCVWVVCFSVAIDFKAEVG